MWRFILISAALCIEVQTAKLPSYMTRCPWNGPIEKTYACAEKDANNAIPKFQTGDKKYRIPSMHPLVVPKIEITQGTNQIGMKLMWTPAKLWGLDSAKVSNMIVDTKKKFTKFDILMSQFVITGHYKAGGRILLLPITGEGDSNITLTNLKVQYQFDWPPKKGPDGKDYADIQNGSIKILDCDLMTVRLYGLFGGDRLLSNNMHSFLNENWRDVLKELGPGVADAIGEVVKLVVANLAHAVPLNEMFSDSPY